MTSSQETVAALIAAYVSAAEGHGDATERGDHRAANEHHDRLVDSFHQLEDRGDAGWMALRNLLGHEKVFVRCWAATHVLKVEPKLASEVLEEISRLPNFTGFDAKMVLAEWRKGTLKWA